MPLLSVLDVTRFGSVPSGWLGRVLPMGILLDCKPR
jgi:hypothetical protein